MKLLPLEIPEEVEKRLREGWSNLPRKALEALAVEAYRSDVLTAAEVGRMLGFASRWEVETFLGQSAGFLHYSDADFAADLERLRTALGR